MYKKMTTSSYIEVGSQLWERFLPNKQIFLLPSWLQAQRAQLGTVLEFSNKVERALESVHISHKNVTTVGGSKAA